MYVAHRVSSLKNLFFSPYERHSCRSYAISRKCQRGYTKDIKAVRTYSWDTPLISDSEICTPRALNHEIRSAYFTFFSRDIPYRLFEPWNYYTDPGFSILIADFLLSGVNVSAVSGAKRFGWRLQFFFSSSNVSNLLVHTIFNVPELVNHPEMLSCIFYWAVLAAGRTESASEVIT